MLSCLALYALWFYSCKWIYLCWTTLRRGAVVLSKSRTDVLLAYDIAGIITQCMDLIEQIRALTLALHVFENFLPQNIKP